jgi:hypothetical protein
VNAPFLLGGGNTLHAMHAAFSLQNIPGAGAQNAKNDFLEAAQFGFRN